MAMGTSDYLPLGITTHESKLVRRRKVAGTAALIALAVIGIAQTAGRLTTGDHRRADVQAAAGPAPLAAEAPIPAEVRPPSDGVVAPIAPGKPPAIDFPTSSPTPVQTAPPTIIRGAGTKPH